MSQILIPFASALATAVAGTVVAWLLARTHTGRLGRTFDQATKIIEFVEHFSAAYENLTKITSTQRNDVEKLMLDAAEAVQKDFAAERAVLGEFGRTTSSIRNILLLRLPNRSIIWAPYVLFYTFLLFVIYLFVVVIVQFEIKQHVEITAIVTLLIAALCAVFIRLVVQLVDATA